MGHPKLHDSHFLAMGLALLAACATPQESSQLQAQPAVRAPAALAEGVAPTREFEVRGDRAWLGGHEIDLWGLRCGNALYSQA